MQRRLFRFLIKRQFSTPKEVFLQQIRQGQVVESVCQFKALEVLDQLHNQLETFEFPEIEDLEEHIQIPKYDYKVSSDSNVSNLTFEVPVQSVYLFGPVGTGKTYLLDLAYDSCPVVAKRRMHFTEFIKDVHATLHEWQQTNKCETGHDIMRLYAKELASQTKIIFLDELQVTDPANLAILVRLFSYLFQYGTIVVTTSNRNPDDLYKGGMAEHLMKALKELLQTCCVIHQFERENDFRASKRVAEGSDYEPCILVPNSSENNQTIAKIWKKVDRIYGPSQPVTIKVQGRDLLIPNACAGVARFTFSEICGSFLGPNDYLAIANAFQMIIVEDIPTLTWNTREEARRLIWLIDAAYERKCQFWATSAKQPEEMFEGDRRPVEVDIMHLEMMADIRAELNNQGETRQIHLFSGEEEVFAFRRCISRLYEMGTQEYRSSPHSPIEETDPLALTAKTPERPEDYQTIAEKMWAPRDFPTFSEDHFKEKWGNEPGTAKSMSRKQASKGEDDS